jgi:hypothetical protein
MNLYDVTVYDNKHKVTVTWKNVGADTEDKAFERVVVAMRGDGVPRRLIMKKNIEEVAS